MFGLLYVIFICVVLAVNSIGKEIENGNARQKSLNDDGVVIGNGKSYYHGVEAHYHYDRGNTYIIDKKGNVLKDYTGDAKRNRFMRNQERWNIVLERAKRNNKLAFSYNPAKGRIYGEYYTDDFAMKHPKEDMRLQH